MADPTTTITTDIPTALEGSLDAPIIYFDNVPVFGIGPGIGRIALEAGVQEINESGQTVVRRRVVAHLRGNAFAFEALRTAINGMEEMIAPAGDPSKVN